MARFRKKPKTVAILVLGQSNEQGSVPVTTADLASYPQAFRSLQNDGMFIPLSPDIGVVDRGGWWCKVYDDLRDYGYEAEIINAAVGGVSILTHICGFHQTRANSTAYYMKRATPIYPDRGDFGDVINFSSKTFNVTAGARKRSVFNGGPNPNAVATTNGPADYLTAESTSLLSAGSAPDVSAVAVGGTVTDGDLTLTRLDETQYVSSSTYDPAGNNNLGGVLGERLVGRGFDPLAILARGWEALSKSRAEKKIVYFSQGQADLGTGATTYGRAAAILATFYLRRGCDVILGNTSYSPGSSLSTTANYDLQVTGIANAIDLVDDTWPTRIHQGANLFGGLGSTGNMGGQKCTGGTGGVSSTTLTISAVQANSGTGLAVGQNVWNGTTLVGIIDALGSGSGGTGTYTLDRSATVANGTALVAAGAYLQYDGVHLNAPGAIAAGALVADSIKAIMTDRRPLVI